VRCPRGRQLNYLGADAAANWNGVNDIWLSARNNVHQLPGCDLVVHHTGVDELDPGHDEVLVDCDETDTDTPVCSVADPFVSFDGRSIYYAKFTDTREILDDSNLTPRMKPSTHSQRVSRLDATGGNGTYATLGGFPPLIYNAPVLIYRYDLDTGENTQVSPASALMAGRAYPGRDSEWTFPLPVMDTAPFMMADGRIGFTSNRDSGFTRFELFAMDRDGQNLEKLGHRAMVQQLHPVPLMDGRIMYSNFDVMLSRPGNNDYSLFTINPDGSFPFILAGKQDSSNLSYHFATQLSDGDIVTALYYNNNNTGMGSLQRFPVDPAGADFQHMNHAYRPLGELDNWQPGIALMPFARKGEYRLTVDASAGDSAAGHYQEPGDYWVHPADGRIVTLRGKYSHPSGAPANDLLVAYSIGDTTVNAHYRDSLEATMARIGKDAGVWLLALEPQGREVVAHVAPGQPGSDDDRARIVVDWPQYHEIMPRALVPYRDIYGMDAPRDPGRTRTSDARLTPGAPHALSGASSMIDRETQSLNGTPWNARDGGGFHSGRSYTNLFTHGADLALYDDEEIHGVRITLPIPKQPGHYFNNAEQWATSQHHHLRILGEFPVRKGEGMVDVQGNPDTSFLVKLPADTPFLMQAIDQRGMALNLETTSRTAVAGEVQLCTGCHVHTREGMDPYQSLAYTDHSLPLGDFTGDSAPLFSGMDENGEILVAEARAVFDEVLAPAVNSRRSFAVDWDTGVAGILEANCAGCHGSGQEAEQLTGLRLDGSRQTYDLLTQNQYQREDGVTIDHSTRPGDGLTDLDAPGTDRITNRMGGTTASRWLSLFSARSSMLIWALYGERLDGRDPATGLPPADRPDVLVDDKGREHPEIWPRVAEHLEYVTGMSEQEKMLLARWIDLGAPLANTHDDMIRPVLTVTPVVQNDRIGQVLLGVWDDSPLDYGRFRFTVDGRDITPSLQDEPTVITLNLPNPVPRDAGHQQRFVFEVWDRPDRRFSLDSPATPAANRTRVELTGAGLWQRAAE